MLDGENNLTNRAISGESSAFGLLYDHYQPKIYRFIYLKVGHREEAEDLTHQVFLSAWNNIRGYESRGFPFSSWLYRIARNQVIDHYRTKKPTSSLDDVDVESHITEDKSGTLAETKIEMERVRMALAKLKPEYQEIIIMRFVEDLSIKETAQTLGKSEGAIKLLQHRATKKLKEGFQIS